MMTRNEFIQTMEAITSISPKRVGWSDLPIDYTPVAIEAAKSLQRVVQVAVREEMAGAAQL